MALTFLDITDRKRAEDEIRTAARRREEFLAMLSPQLRNPLSAVVSAARVMRAPAVKPEVIDKARQIVERQSRHMARLLDDLLDVTRITRGGIELRKDLRVSDHPLCGASVASRLFIDAAATPHEEGNAPTLYSLVIHSQLL